MPLLNKLKAGLQHVLGRFGLRVVPANRDAASLLKQVQAGGIATVIDVGSNRGDTLRQWRAMFPDARIHAFEPLPKMQAALEVVRAQAPDRVTIWPVAASDDDGEARFRVHVDHPSSSSLLPRTEKCAGMFDFTLREEEIVVKTARIDRLLGPRSDAHLRRPMLMKLDVQGAELSVLKGAVAVLAETDFIICEVNLTDLYVGQCSFYDLLGFTQAQGFKFAGFLEEFSLPDGTAVYVDALFRRDLSA